MPLQAKANYLQLDPMPAELFHLNSLELRLISLRVPFMKMVALLSGKQRCIHGPAVNVPLQHMHNADVEMVVKEGVVDGRMLIAKGQVGVKYKWWMICACLVSFYVPSLHPP